MLFPSPIFLFLFLPIVLALYFIIPRSRRFARNILLLIASLFFYAWGEGSYTLVLLSMIVLNYFFGRMILHQSGKPSKAWLALAVATNLGFIVYFKYAVFFVLTAASFLAHLHIHPSPNMAIHMPLGISFITFHCLSYCIDVYRKKIKVERNFWDLALYLALFPHLIAGPIVRYSSIGQQIKKRRESAELFASGAERLVLGLGKKMIIANSMAEIADKIFAIFPQRMTPDILWLGLIAYTLQIFFDFSGYSDMAIGLARMFGFEFAENFNYPYISQSAQEFWRRWHMTLSSWFRDYLYIPLGGNRKGLAWTCLNIMIVFLLTGLWHGDSWHFIFWGGYYGFFLVLERLFLSNVLSRLWWPIRHFYALAVIIFGWLFFRIENLHYAFFLLRELLGLGIKNARVYSLDTFLTPQAKIIFIIAILGCTPIFSYLTNQLGKLSKRGAWTIGYRLGGVFFMMLVLFYSILQLVSDTYNPFIYFRF